ncbi:MAG: HisA/HisF-related TIM barrel protein [Candidatus Thiodiazotropha sp.]
MKLIPVIDLMNGMVVTAIRGQRHNYLPCTTPLCRSSQPEAVISALLGLYPFDTLYIADLDAITGDGANTALISELSRRFSKNHFWVDNGLNDLQHLQSFARPVIGTESLSTLQQLSHLITSLPSPLLSLDFVDNRFKGPAGLMDHPELWPEDVIVMSLSHVGSAGGADTSRMQQLRQLSVKHRFYAAGGIRDQRDLQQIEALGGSGALLSTALHQGTIDSSTLNAYLSDSHSQTSTINQTSKKLNP